MSVSVRARGVEKAYATAPARSTCCAGSTSTSSRARWWPSSGRRAPENRRCCTSWARSTGPTRAEVEVGGAGSRRAARRRLAAFRNRTLGFVFQFHQLLAGLHRARERRSSGTHRRRRPRRALRRRAAALLEEVGLADRADHFPDQLSGGEQQRVALSPRPAARAAAPAGRRADRQPRSRERRARSSICLSSSSGRHRDDRGGGHPQPGDRPPLW